MRRSLLAYGAALFAVAVAVVTRLALDPFLEDRFPLITLFLVVVLVTAIYGRGPAMLAMVTGGVSAAYFIFEPRYSFPFRPHYLIGLSLYVIASFVMAQFIEALRNSRLRAEQKQHEAEVEARSRLAAERGLVEREELLRTTLASIGDAVITTDNAGRVASMNGVAETLTGWRSREAVGRLLTEVFRVVHEETREPIESLVSRVVREGQIIRLQTRTLLVGRNGAERAIDESASPIRGDAGVILGVVLVFRDVTEQREAQRKLLEADHRKDEFLATLAHELRNPLAPIANSLEILRHAGGDARMLEESRLTMERQLDQLVRLVDDLMDVSRITRNKLRLRRQRTDLTPAIEQAIELCRPMARARNHDVHWRAPRPIFVDADPVRLVQIFGNALNNACKYTEYAGRIDIVAELRESRAIVRIRDNGIGISAETLPKVFDLFTQADGALERAEGGLGIGLSLVKRLVDLHGGSVTAASEGVGRGSEFVIELPAAADQTAEPPPACVDDASAASARRVLVVDDNVDSANSLAVLLKLTGNEVVIAHDGGDAFAKAERHKPDLVMLDIGLPDISGYDVCQQIRAERWGRSMMLVALTGWGQEEDRRKSREAGFDVHLVKPLDYDALMKVLAGSRGERATGA